MKTKNVQIIDIGNSVVCDLCGADYTNSDKQGGILFGSSAVCPACTPDVLKSTKKYHEKEHLKGECPKDMSFKDWVLKLRAGDNTIIIETYT